MFLAMVWTRSLSRPVISERSPVRSRVFSRIWESVPLCSETTSSTWRVIRARFSTISRRLPWLPLTVFARSPVTAWTSMAIFAIASMSSCVVAADRAQTISRFSSGRSRSFGVASVPGVASRTASGRSAEG